MKTPQLFGLLCVVASAPALFAQAQNPEVTELSQALEPLPRQVLLDLNGSKKNAGMMQATDVLREKVQGRQATLKFKVERIEKDPPGDDKKDRFRVKADDVRLNKGTTHFVSNLWIHFDPAESDKIIALKKGAQVTATGRISLASITEGTPIHLHIDLSEAKLK